MRQVLLLFTFAFSLLNLQAQWEPDRIYKDNIRSVKLTMLGDQLGYPVIGLNSTDQLQLDFDDMEPHKLAVAGCT